MNSTNGMLMLGSTLTNAAVGLYAVTVTATNAGSPPRSANTTVNVSIFAVAVNYPPYFLNPPIATTTIYFFSVLSTYFVIELTSCNTKSLCLV